MFRIPRKTFVEDYFGWCILLVNFVLWINWFFFNFWRLDQLRLESTSNNEQQNETIRHLAQQNETISITFKVNIR